MKTKQMLITMALVLMALCSVQTASALSVFVHNHNVPAEGAQITYTVRDESIRYMYTFHRLVTPGSGEIELTLPVIFQEGDTVTVSMSMTNPFELVQDTDSAVMGLEGVDAWYDLSPPQ